MRWAPEFIGLAIVLALAVLLVLNVVTTPGERTCYAGYMAERDGTWRVWLHPVACERGR